MVDDEITLLSGDCRSNCRATLVALEAVEIGAETWLASVGTRITLAIVLSEPFAVLRQYKRAEKMEPPAPGVSLTQSTIHFTSELSRTLG